MMTKKEKKKLLDESKATVINVICQKCLCTENKECICSIKLIGLALGRIQLYDMEKATLRNHVPRKTKQWN